MNAKDHLRRWFKIWQEEFNIFEARALCSRFKIELRAADTNHSSCIVKYQGKRWYLSTFENTCRPA